MDSIRHAEWPFRCRRLRRAGRIAGALSVGGAAFFLTACGGSQSGLSPICTMEARSSFAVTVVDSVSGANLAPAALVRVAPAARPDSSVDLVAAGGVYSGALYERSGTFELSVSRSGYAPWRMTNVQVDRDECHVITRALTARLRPAG